MAERLGGTVTFLFTDVEASTRLLKALGRERYGRLLLEHQELLREAFAAYRGEEVDTQGDAFFVAFRSASDAVAAAVELQRALAAHEWPEGAEVRVRVGIHSGEAVGTGERYVGFSVHRAARIGAAGHGGQVLVSGATRALVEDDLPAGAALRDLGLWRLKDIERPERISQVEADGLRSGFPPLRAAERVRQPVLRRRSLLAAAAAGVIAAAVAVPLFALGGGPSGGTVYASLTGNSVGAVSGNRIVGAVSLGSAPGAIAAGAGSLWVTVPSRDVVVRIDAGTNTIEQTIRVGSGPDAVAVGGGFVWVVNGLAGTVTQIDPRSNGGQAVSTFPVGNGPSGIAYGLGFVWVANSADRTVVRIDPRTGRRSSPIRVADGADALAAGAGAVWVASASAGIVSRVDPASRTIAQRISVGSDPSAVAVDAGTVWVANRQDDTVTRIDAASGRPTGLVPVGDAPGGLAVLAGGSVWVANAVSGTLSQIDPTRNAVVHVQRVGGLPSAVALNGGSVYVAVSAPAGAHRGGTLTVAISNPPGIYEAPIPTSLDPATGYSAWELLPLTNDGLLAYGRSGGAAGYRVVPDLAVALPTVGDGGRTYTFRLRSGIRWSTGAAVRPADIRAGVERALAKSKGRNPGAYLAGVVGAGECMRSPRTCDLARGIVVSPGSQTITFRLTAPDPDFLYQLALPVFDAVPAGTPLDARLPLPATGPYRVASYDAKRGVIRVVRNPRFRVWSAAARPDGYPDEIVERYRYSGAAAVQAVERGRADITTDGLDQTWPAALAARLRTRASSRLYSEPLLGTLGLWLNTRLAPFDDVRVRRALNDAVDRNRLVALNGGTLAAGVTCQILLANFEGYSRYCPYTRRPTPDGAYVGPDLAKARRLVAASGTKGGPVTLWFYDIPIGRANGRYLVSVLRSLGYRARLRLVPHDGQGTWRPDRQAGVQGWGSDYPSSNALFSSTFSCAAYTRDPQTNANLPGLCDRRVDAQIARARALDATGRGGAGALWARIDRRLSDAAPWVPLKAILSADLVSRRTGNYRYCWLAGATGIVSACLDQLWVR